MKRKESLIIEAHQQLDTKAATLAAFAVPLAGAEMAEALPA